MPVFLTAPKDLQRTLTYEELLRVLRQERHQGEEVVADRDLFRDNRHWKKSWKKVYEGADKLYVLAREDGTVGLGIYKQWKFLSERAVPSEVFFAGAKSAAEEGYEDFDLKRIEVAKGEEDPARFALVDLRS
ncbi:MAG: hypothetical protein M3441_25415 [Chloroflexota bacterium]|jgi:hypothetical protein|nr:hypothetical protein [Chloroflexota bacterium]